MATNAERQRAFKQRLREAGLIQLSGWVHPHQAARLAVLMEALKNDPNLEVGPARVAATGRLKRIE